MSRTDQLAAPGPLVDDQAVTFRVADPGHELRSVRLYQEVGVPGDRLDLRWQAGVWSLHLARPAVDRMEYLFQVTGPDGGEDWVRDPGNPSRVGGAFGDKSVLEFPGYRPPRWLVGPPPRRGRLRELAVPARSLGSQVGARVWSPPDVLDTEQLPLLVVHDGPEYDVLASLTTYLGVLVERRVVAPLRAALLDPGERNEWYSANGAYARALALAVLPRLREAAPTTTVIGMGTSLGALAMLHAHRRHDGLVDALFLQSGSFFHPRHDAHERRFARYDRVVRAVDEILRAGGYRSPVPAVLTCGAIEENLANNRIMARALAAQGYDVTLREVPDVHNYTGWRDAFDPHLTGLLRLVAR
ncbi:MAG: hypothetical protein QOE01_73 [Actinomycetota bacterium]|nr:hypothetical protein [Actinomycetota bacterium]